MADNDKIAAAIHQLRCDLIEWDGELHDHTRCAIMALAYKLSELEQRVEVLQEATRRAHPYEYKYASKKKGMDERAEG